jgi:hypothetical protein
MLEVEGSTHGHILGHVNCSKEASGPKMPGNPIIVGSSESVSKGEASQLGIEWNRIKKLSEHKKEVWCIQQQPNPGPLLLGFCFFTVILSKGFYLFLNINLYSLALEEQLATSLLPSYLG